MFVPLEFCITAPAPQGSLQHSPHLPISPNPSSPVLAAQTFPFLLSESTSLRLSRGWQRQVVVFAPQLQSDNARKALRELKLR